MNSVPDQVHAIRTTAGLLTGFQRRLLAVHGLDRVKFLHNLATHDIKGLSHGQGRPACLLDRHGKIRAAFLVHSRPDELILEIDPSHFDPAREALEQHRISEAVEFTEVTNQYKIIALHGPAVDQILARARPEIQCPCAPFNHGEGPAGSEIHLILRWDLFHLPGLHLWIKPESEPAVHKELLEEGRPFGLQTISKEAFEILRIEAGVPWPGAEIDETVILNELGTEEFVSFTKGCFIGQEIVARIKYRAHPPRLLKGFLIEESTPAAVGSSILLNQETVGTITSSCFSPTLNRPIALGFLKYGVESSNLKVETPSGPAGLAVTPVPFV